MGRKMVSEQYWQGKDNSTICGILGETEVLKKVKATATEPAREEMQHRWTVTGGDDIAWVLPDHYSLDAMLKKNQVKAGQSVELIYLGCIGPVARGKKMAVWTGSIDDEKK